jgi:glycosyltransferase involved in cell wall biosynthesis
MPSLYRAADLFVYPNPPYESFGLVFLEALATNIPVIATDDPIRREIIGSAGLFINPACPHSISTAITQALKINWNTNPRQQVEKFSWDKIGKKYSQILLS